MSRKVKACIIDAFCKDNAGGSPTGVVLDARGLTDGQMQYVANQLDVSHTAFVLEPDTPGNPVGVRFFTSGGEIRNCGHGTIAAHYARVAERVTHDMTFAQQARDGLQQVEIMHGSDGIAVFLQQNPIRFSSADPATVDTLLATLSVTYADLDEQYPVILASPGVDRFLVAVRSEAVLNGMRPDFARLKELCTGIGSIGCFVYTIDSADSFPEATGRMFAPVIGVDEDVINGNSSGCLGAYLIHLNGENNIDLLVTQGQRLGKPGLVKVRVTRTATEYATVIGGNAITRTQLVLTVGDDIL